MEKQLIISVGREFGSGGHMIAEALAERFGLPLYDSNLLEHIAAEKNSGYTGTVDGSSGTEGRNPAGISHAELKKYDEKPRNRLLSITVRGHSSSIQENVANMQFDYMKRMADSGKSFVIVGRCAETKLKGNPGLVSLFILGDRDVKAERVMKIYGVSREEALHMMARQDWERKSYHNYYCSGKWGDSRNYDFSVNSSRLGIEKTVDILETYIRCRMYETV